MKDFCNHENEDNNTFEWNYLSNIRNPKRIFHHGWCGKRQNVVYLCRQFFESKMKVLKRAFWKFTPSKRHFVIQNGHFVTVGVG